MPIYRRRVNAEMKIVLGPASKELGEKIAESTGLGTVPVVDKTFPDGENYLRLEGNVQNEHVVIVQTTSPPQDTKLMQLAFIADAAKRNGAQKITAVVPYLAYARQDRIFLQGENISVETVGNMLAATGINELITVNVHQENALAKFPFPARSLSAIPLIAKYFIKKGLRKAFALSPDKGALHIAQQAQQILGGESGHLNKQRDRHTGQTSQTGKGLNVKGQTVIIFDDIISTGGTIVGAAKILRGLGAAHVLTACVHALLVGDAEKRILDAGVEEIVGTDSILSSVNKVSLAPLISNEIRKIRSG